jgi:hypothetical protein
VIYDPITTFVIYMVGIIFLLTLVAAVADWSLARTERKLRDQARAEARAKLREEMEASPAEWLS